MRNVKLLIGVVKSVGLAAALRRWRLLHCAKQEHAADPMRGKPRSSGRGQERGRQRVPVLWVGGSWVAPAALLDAADRSGVEALASETTSP
jgi:hypothetical protein